jgi:hypothetical protein
MSTIRTQRAGLRADRRPGGALRDGLRAAEQPPYPSPLGSIPFQHVNKATQGATGVRVYERQPRLSPRLERLPHIRLRPLRRYEPKQPLVHARADRCSASPHDTPPYCMRCCWRNSVLDQAHQRPVRRGDIVEDPRAGRGGGKSYRRRVRRRRPRRTGACRTGGNTMTGAGFSTRPQTTLGQDHRELISPICPFLGGTVLDPGHRPHFSLLGSRRSKITRKFASERDEWWPRVVWSPTKKRIPQVHGGGASTSPAASPCVRSGGRRSEGGRVGPTPFTSAGVRPARRRLHHHPQARSRP